MRRLLLVIAVVAAGCGWPDHAFDVDAGLEGDATRDDAPADAAELEAGELPSPTSCPPSPDSAGFCAELRDFGGPFTLDGSGSEFCRTESTQLPPRRFSVSSSARTWPSPAPAMPEKFEVRAGIDAVGVHVFVQVLGDPHVLVDRDDPMKGDAVEVFLRGALDRVLDGSLEADEAHHLVLSPPTEGAAGVGLRYLRGVPQSPVSASHWRSRRVRGGWEVEVHYPWTVLKNQASPGMVLGFDVVIDLADDPTKPGRQVRAIMHLSPVASSPACEALTYASADPLCDDRSWCLAKAYIP